MNQTALLLLIPIAIGTVASHFVYRPVILIIKVPRSLLIYASQLRNNETAAECHRCSLKFIK